MKITRIIPFPLLNLVGLIIAGMIILIGKVLGAV